LRSNTTGSSWLRSTNSLVPSRRIIIHSAETSIAFRSATKAAGDWDGRGDPAGRKRPLPETKKGLLGRQFQADPFYRENRAWGGDSPL